MIKSATYIKGLVNIKDQPDDKPVNLLLGRSNVGKSSFINALTNRKSLARTSGTPGKTITLNYYLINDEFYIVDAPGYGYARRSKGMQDDFIEMIENVLLNANTIKRIMLLIDFKVGPTALDLDTYEFVKSLNYEIIVVATKKDKIAKTRQYKQEKTIKAMYDKNVKFFSVSNETLDGIDSIRKIILQEHETHE